MVDWEALDDLKWIDLIDNIKNNEFQSLKFVSCIWAFYSVSTLTINC